MASSSGLHRSNTARSPPTQIASFRLLAPAGPPLTGASSTCPPRSLNAAWSRRIRVGELVDRSKNTVPGRRPWMRPSAPSATASTSDGPGSDVNTTSTPSATWRGVSFHCAPLARCGAAADLRMSWTDSAWPAAWRFDAMLAPMMPNPMKPTFMVAPVRGSDAGEDVVPAAEAGGLDDDRLRRIGDGAPDLVALDVPGLQDLRGSRGVI